MRKISITAQIMEVDYELGMRRKVYPGMVSRGTMKQAEADLHTRQLEAVRDTLVFCRDNGGAIRAALTLVRQGEARRSALYCLEASLAEHRANLADLIVTCSHCEQDASGEPVPRPGMLDPEAEDQCKALIQLIGDIEEIVGRPVEHPQPQWLDDLLDAKWSLT